jgi:hypothetical protein
MSFTLRLLLLAATASCMSTRRPLGPFAGLDSVDLASTTTLGSGVSTDDSLGLSRGLAELSFAALEAGFFAGGPGPAPDVAYTEARMLAGRERSEEIRTEARGLGAEFSFAMTPTVYTRVGYWVLEEEDLGPAADSEIGRLSLGLGHVVPFTESTHLAGSIGFQWTAKTEFSEVMRVNSAWTRTLRYAIA